MKSTQHDMVTAERSFSAPVSRLFAAWQDTEALERWCCPGESWQGKVEAHDFQVGGVKRIRFGQPGEIEYFEDSRYIDITAGERIIHFQTMSENGIRIAASVVTLEFAENGTGSTLSVTDQLTLIDTTHAPEGRRDGWSEVLDKLGGELTA